MKTTHASVLVLAIALAIAAPLNAASERKPNVLLVMTDDQGFGDIHSHGNEKIDTPTMDRLAASGARFERFFVSPVCAPTRASLLTGRYHLRTGASWVTWGRENMRSEEVTIAEILKRNGYATGCFGKWHNGAHFPEHPNGQGFDEFFGFCAGHFNNYFNPRLQRNGRQIETHGYITDLLTDEAIAFIEKNRGRPFLCYVPYNAPHTPCQVPDRYYKKYCDRGFDERTAAIYGMIECVDDNLKRLLGAVDRLDLANNTIVFFLTDNGPNGQRFNAGMKGTKGSVDEGGVRVPLFVRWPGRIAAGKVIRQNAAHIDLLPTIAALCAVPVGKTLPLDGRDLSPLLEGNAPDWPDRMIMTLPHIKEMGPNLQGAARTQRWRAIKRRGNWQLFDIVADPGQKKNVAAEHSEVVNELSTAYENTFTESARRGLDSLPIQIGHEGWPEVTLPGHEAFLSPKSGQGISYNREPGYAHSWIANWTDLNAFPFWNLEVVTPGKYEVTLMYGCAPESVGTKLRVEAGDASLEGVVREAHVSEDIPLPHRVGTEHDHYINKTWKPLDLGSISLRAGKTRLCVRTLAAPSGKSIEIKEVRIRRDD